ncbi:MAG: NAD-dependent deacylase, partial [Chitinophagaceae bacterium]
MKLVVLTGAGISAESGLKTFRDSDGLWEGYN